MLEDIYDTSLYAIIHIYDTSLYVMVYIYDKSLHATVYKRHDISSRDGLYYK